MGREKELLRPFEPPRRLRQLNIVVRRFYVFIIGSECCIYSESIPFNQPMQRQPLALALSASIYLRLILCARTGGMCPLIDSWSDERRTTQCIQQQTAEAKVQSATAAAAAAAGECIKKPEFLFCT